MIRRGTTQFDVIRFKASSWDTVKKVEGTKDEG